MADAVQAGLIKATQIAHEVEVRRSANGLRFATYGETGVLAPDLDSMIEAVPPVITAALKDNTYFFVPLALRGPEGKAARASAPPEQAMVAAEYSTELDEQAICHRNVTLGTGQQGIFISTRLMGDRFALCFEFFINIAHAFVDETGVPAQFAELVWRQALDNVRGESSMDAWESRQLALGRSGEEALRQAQPERRSGPQRASGFAVAAAAAAPTVDERERGNFESAAFSDALAIYLLSLAVDFDYGELREREYPLLHPVALAARLRMVAELFPPNKGYEFSVRYRRRA